MLSLECKETTERLEYFQVHVFGKLSVFSQRGPMATSTNYRTIVKSRSYSRNKREV